MKFPDYRAITVSLMALLLSACIGDDGGGGSAPSTPGEKIAALVASGQLPTLDRSPDLKGPDADNNGVRDDIDSWIASKRLPSSQTAALIQHARTLQAAILVDKSNVNAVRKVDQAMGRSIHCLYGIFDTDMARQMVGDLRKFTMNTRQRVLAYGAYATALSGSVLSMPQGNTCD